MAIQVIPINGNSPWMDYHEFEQSFKMFLGPSCNSAVMYILNRFPAPVSTELSIDLLLLIAVENAQGNYTRYPNHENINAYYHNSIIPISVTTGHEHEPIRIEKSFIMLGEVEYDKSNELNSIKYGLANLLVHDCNLERRLLRVQPMELIANDTTSLLIGSQMVSKRINPQQIFTAIKQNTKKFFNCYIPWTARNGGFDKFKADVTAINEAASRYTQYGYLTKKKIARIGDSLTKKSVAFESIGQQPVIINGKAGSGKTSYLLRLLVRCLRNDRNVTFLTYNHLLTKDVAYTVKVIRDKLDMIADRAENGKRRIGTPSVQTLMGYIFRLSKSLGVLHLMTEERSAELKKILRESIQFLQIELPNLTIANFDRIIYSSDSYKETIQLIQNSGWPVPMKQYAIEFMRHLKSRKKSVTNQIPESLQTFFLEKNIQLDEMAHKEVFLRDYTGCLKNSLAAIRNTEKFFEDFNVYEKYELLELLMNLDSRKQDSASRNEKISLETYIKRVKNVIKGRNVRRAVMMIDEAHDCHPLEREILYSIIAPQNTVITFGGKEQLIRFHNTCDWSIFNHRQIRTKTIPFGGKSYRIKKKVLEFCNFLANAYEIELNLEPFSEEDSGEVIFDFRSTKSINKYGVFDRFLEKGAVNGCKPLESLMILDINRPLYERSYNDSGYQNVGVVNEYNVLLDRRTQTVREFPFVEELEQYAQCWIGATNDKRELKFPAPNEVRLINYESCRGLEAWCVMCLNADRFFEIQKTSDQAEMHLLHEGAVMTSEKRAARYAITWLLMAATRAIDTLYLQFDNLNSELAKLCRDYERDKRKNK